MIRTNSITDAAGTGAPDFPHGIKLAGVDFDPGQSGSGSSDITVTAGAGTVQIQAGQGAPGTIPAVTANAAGVMTPALREKLLGAVLTVNGQTPDQDGDVTVAGATNLSATTTATTVIVASSTGNGATLLAATPSTAGVMTAAQVQALQGAATAAALQALADSLGSAASEPASAFATAAQGAKADTALQPGALPEGTTLPAAQVSDSTTAGRALLTAADAAAQRAALGLGSAATAAASAFATSAQGTKADSALQPGALPDGTTLPASQISDSGATGRALVQTATAAAARTALEIGSAALLNADQLAVLNPAGVITTAGNLDRATHANRLLTHRGADATYTLTTDAAGGWIVGDAIEIHTATDSAGVPTLVLPDGQTVTGSKTRAIGATHRDGTNAWTPASTDAARVDEIIFGTHAFLLPARSLTTFSAVGVSATASMATAALVARTTVLTDLGYPQRVGVQSSSAAASNISGGMTTSSTSTPLFMPGSDPMEQVQEFTMIAGVVDTAGVGARFAIGAFSATPFGGVSSTSGIAAANVNAILFGWDANATADANCSIMVCSATAGVVTKVDLGSSFPAAQVAAKNGGWYAVTFRLYPGISRRLRYRVENLATGAVAVGEVSTNLPTAGTALRLGGIRSSGAISTVVPEWDFGGAWIGSALQRRVAW